MSRLIQLLVADGWEVEKVITPTGETKNRLPWSVVSNPSETPVAILTFATRAKAEEACAKLANVGCEVMVTAKAMRIYPKHFVL